MRILKHPLRVGHTGNNVKVEWINFLERTPSDAAIDCSELWTWDGTKVSTLWWEGGWSYGPDLWFDPVLHDTHITHWAFKGNYDEDEDFENIIYPDQPE